MRYAIGIDLGGTNIKLASVSESGDTLEARSFETRDTEGRWAELIREAVHALESDPDFRASAIGIATPGLPTPDLQRVGALQGRLHGLVGLDWSELLSTRATVRVLNDAQAALLGEAWRGAAVGCANVVLLTLGTGVGGAILLDGRLLRGHIGRAG